MKRCINLAAKPISFVSNEKGKIIQNILDYFFPNPPVPLNSHSNFTFLCAVVLSSQTTDGQVNQATTRLFQISDTPEGISKLDPVIVQEAIRCVGLTKTKASNLIRLSQILVEQFEGKVPNTFRELELLPGVGHKVASVVMSQLFHIPSLPVDTHIHRLALRWGLTKEQKNAYKVQQDLCQIFPENIWNKIHLQIIYFAREYCPAKGHLDINCPICCWINGLTSPPPSPSLTHSFAPQVKLEFPTLAQHLPFHAAADDDDDEKEKEEDTVNDSSRLISPKISVAPHVPSYPRRSISSCSSAESKCDPEANTQKDQDDENGDEDEDGDEDGCNSFRKSKKRKEEDSQSVSRSTFFPLPSEVVTLEGSDTFTHIKSSTQKFSTKKEGNKIKAEKKLLQTLQQKQQTQQGFGLCQQTAPSLIPVLIPVTLPNPGSFISFVSRFSPQAPQMKSVVSYHTRLEELKQNPSLSSFGD